MMKNLDNALREGRKGSSFWVYPAIISIASFLYFSAYLVSENLIQERIALDAERVTERVKYQALNKKSRVFSWLSSKASLGESLSTSPALRMFVGEAGLQKGDVETWDSTLLDQVTYMNKVLKEHSLEHNLLGVFVLDDKGRILLGTSKPDYIHTSYRHFFTSKVRQGEVVSSSLKIYGDLIILNVLQPIYALQGDTEGRETPSVKGSLVSVFNVRHELDELFTEKKSSDAYYLFQKEEDVISWVKFMPTPMLIHPSPKTVNNGIWKAYYNENIILTESSQRFKWGEKGGILADDTVVAVRVELEDTPFSILHFLNMSSMNESIETYGYSVRVNSYMMATIILMVMLSLWWWFRQVKTTRLFKKYKKISTQLERNNALLESINSSIQELVFYQTVGGEFIYANRAFLEFYGVDHNIEGGKIDMFFSSEECQILEEMDKKALLGRDSHDTILDVTLHGEKYSFEVSKTPVRSSVKGYTGIVTVMRNMTAITHERRLRTRVLSNFNKAIVRIIESKDPKVARFTKYFHQISTMLGKYMKLSDEDILVLDVVSKFSQIGQVITPVGFEDISLDKDLGGLESTLFIFDTVNWGEWPVSEVMSQIFERLDGSGKPSGIKGSQMHYLAKVMAVCYAFCEMTTEREHAEFFTPEQAVRKLMAQKDKFDIQIVTKLTEMIVQDKGVVVSLAG